MTERYTDNARRAIGAAFKEASHLHHTQVDTEHLLLALLRDPDGKSVRCLEDLDIGVLDIREQLELLMDRRPKNPFYTGKVDYTYRVQEVMQFAAEEARFFNAPSVDTDHLLLGLLREGRGIAATVLANFHIDLDDLRRAIARREGLLERQRASQPAVHGSGEKAPQVSPLEQFSRDLTAFARKGDLDPLIGRSDELERLVQILLRRTKNNPVLIGEPGVGKTAIVEGLAQAIASGKVPAALAGRRLLALDLGALIAGTKYRGQFEERVKGIMNEIRRLKDVVLFIDELHTLIGTGAAEGAVDAANMLKPALARGELQCIGATTLGEYRKHIERDGALERRFQPILVEAPTEDQTLSILEGLRPRYEEHHQITYLDDALTAAVRLSSRYIQDRFLPDKAIDVLDEAGALVRLRHYNTSESFRQIEDKLRAIAVEKINARTAKESRRVETLERYEGDLRAQQRTEQMTVGSKEVAEVVSRWSGIPVARLAEEESLKTLRLSDALRERIIGQEEAVHLVSRAIRRSRAGMKNPRRPIGSFLFVGPTGVGKTYLAHQIAEILFDSPDALIRIDMSEFMERFAVSRLTGAPPGYVGYAEGGDLTEKVRRRPYSVVLLDEIEKAHPDIYNLLLQVLEDGRMTDSLGNVVDFRNTLLIMTSNVGARDIVRSRSVGFGANGDGHFEYETMREKITAELRKTFNPEFLNRVDEVVVFRPLERADVRKILVLMVDEVRERMLENGYRLSVTPEVYDLLIERGYDPLSGARTLRREVQRQLEDTLAEEILRQNPEPDALIVVARNGDELRIVTESPHIEEADEEEEMIPS